jgi:hypothetical protein
MGFVLGVVGEDIGLSAAMGIASPMIALLRRIRSCFLRIGQTKD